MVLQHNMTNLKHNSTTRVPITTKPGRMVTYLEGFLPIVTQPFFTHGLVISCDKLKPLYLHCQSSNYHQTWQMVTCLKGLLTITLPDSFMWQTKTIISLLPQYLWPSNMAEWGLAMKSPHPKSRITLWSHGLARSHDKFKLLSLHYHHAYGH